MIEDRESWGGGHQLFRQFSDDSRAITTLYALVLR